MRCSRLTLIIHVQVKYYFFWWFPTSWHGDYSHEIKSLIFIFKAKDRYRFNFICEIYLNTRKRNVKEQSDKRRNNLQMFKFKYRAYYYLDYLLHRHITSICCHWDDLKVSFLTLQLISSTALTEKNKSWKWVEKIIYKLQTHMWGWCSRWKLVVNLISVVEWTVNLNNSQYSTVDSPQTAKQSQQKPAEAISLWNI